MQLEKLKNSKTISDMIALGQYGHMALFDTKTIEEALVSAPLPLTNGEIKRASKIFDSIEKYEYFNHKQDMINSLDQNDKSIVVKTLLGLIEGQIIDQGISIQ